jgi:RimJ/RimL family protein N-acetyltransferase
MGLARTLDCGRCLLRPWDPGDRASLLRHANNRNIWRNLRDHFPHPYDAAAADGWLAVTATGNPPEGIWAIDVGGEAVGCLAVERQSDINRGSAEVGYWLSESLWGRGIISAALPIATEHALAQPDLWRLYAPVFPWNPASMRVLEKAGFRREAILHQAGFKDGTVIDEVVYSRVRAIDLPYVPAT